MITEYVDDELPLPPFEELFGGEEFSPLEKGKRPTKRSTKDGLSSKDESTGYESDRTCTTYTLIKVIVLIHFYAYTFGIYFVVCTCTNFLF